MTIQLYQIRQIVLKKEATPGTDAAPVGTTDAMLTYNGTVAIEADKLERNQDHPYFGADPFLLVHKRATVSFEMELIGASTLGLSAPCAPALMACGMAETLVATTSATYNPVSSGFTSATLYFFIGPLRCTMVYSMANMEITQEIKSWNRAKFTFTGVITNTTLPTEAVVGTTTLTAFQAPPAVEDESWIVTAAATHLSAKKFSLNLNNDVKIHEASELRQVYIMDRKPTGSMTILEPTLATYNPWALATALTPQNFVSVVGTVPTKICTVTLPTAQIEYAKITNIDGAICFEIPFNAVPNAGNDEFSIKFT